MAFRMNRSIIKGTVNHKASIAKAKKAVVSQARVKADPTLVKSGELLGKSYIPEAIDYTIDQPEIKIPKKKELTEEEKAARDARRAERKAARDLRKQTRKDRRELRKADDKPGTVVSRTAKKIGKGIVGGAGVIINAAGQIVNAAGDVIEGVINAAGEIVNEAGKVIGNVKGNVENTLSNIDESLKPDAETLARMEAQEEYRKNPVEPIETNLRTKPLPTNARKLELIQSTNELPESTDSADRFMAAAEREGIEIKNVEDYEKAERLLFYDEELGDWRTKKEKIIVDAPIEGEGGDDLIIASELYGVDAGSMEKQEDGSWKPKEGAKHFKYGDTWDANAGAWRDDDKEQYFGPEGQKITKATADKFAKSQEKKAEKALRQQNLDEARAYYGDVVTTQPRFDEYMRMKEEGTLAESYEDQLDQENFPDIEEEPDPLPGEPGYDKAIHGNIKERKAEQERLKREKKTPTSESVTTSRQKKREELAELKRLRKKKMADKKWNNPTTSQYIKDQMLKEGYVPSQEIKSAALMRDDRIWRNAVKGGRVHKNMLKSGYIPLNE